MENEMEKVMADLAKKNVVKNENSRLTCPLFSDIVLSEIQEKLNIKPKKEKKHRPRKRKE